MKQRTKIQSRHHGHVADALTAPVEQLQHVCDLLQVLTNYDDLRDSKELGHLASIIGSIERSVLDVYGALDDLKDSMEAKQAV